MNSPENPDQTPPAPMSRKTKRGIVYTVEETNQQLEAVEQLLQICTPMPKVVRAMRRQFSVTSERVKTLAARIADRWAREDNAPIVQNRQAQIRRLLGYLQHARGKRDQVTGAWVEKPNHLAIARYEKEIALLQGTYRPVKVDVEVAASQAVLAVITNMDADRVAEYLESARRVFGDAPALPAHAHVDDAAE